jgi:gliding motility-associated-like protein
MTRIFLLVSLFLLISMEGAGQCLYPPTVTLSSTSGITCGTAPLTISGNTFGGSASKVTIAENGAGTVSPTTSNTSPFAFTYTPKNADAGKKVIITVTTNNPLGTHCAAAKATFTLTVNVNPSAPVIGTITQPTCSVMTGSVILSGLPSNGTWTLTRIPGGITTTGTGTSTIIYDLAMGTYTYTVTYSGCTSVASANVVINNQSSNPSAPVVGTITQPTCILSTGSVVLNGLPATGTWTLTRYPGTITSTGTGTSITISGLVSGVYNYMVTNSSGCVSGLSDNVIISPQPTTPSSPLIGTITQPIYELPTGSVVLNGLPDTGSWTLTRSPDEVSTSGTGISKTITGLTPGTYTFTVTTSEGCTSASSSSVIINQPTSAPILTVTDPAPVCFPSTVDLTAPAITAGSTPNQTYTYWADTAASIPYGTPASAIAGKYYIKSIAKSGFSIVKPVTVTIFHTPIANAGTDQVVDYLAGTTMNAELDNVYETGVWSVISGTGKFSDSTNAKTSVNGLSKGENKFLWTVKNGVCPSSSSTVIIIVQDVIIPTLITPNMDGKNDYFVLKGFSRLGKIELVIFDRRGVQVYKNRNYNDLWNGVDYNGNPLPDDTYFYVLKTASGISFSGYIVIRR